MSRLLLAALIGAFYGWSVVSAQGARVPGTLVSPPNPATFTMQILDGGGTADGVPPTSWELWAVVKVRGAGCFNATAHMATMTIEYQATPCP